MYGTGEDDLNWSFGVISMVISMVKESQNRRGELAGGFLW